MLALNSSALAAPLAYGSNAAFMSDMEQLLKETRTLTFRGPAPRAVLVHDTAAFKKHIKENLQATVTITVERAPKPRSWLPLINLESERPQSLFRIGSGAIVTKDGYIVTNNHVVAGASKISVVLNDKQEVSAKIIGDNFPTIRWGDSDRLEIGDMVVAIGSPGKLTQTVTSGIVSQLHRRPGVSKYEDTIQIDAALNPGSSGGPLFHGESGKLIGINSAIVSPNGAFAGVGLTIPGAVAKEISAVLIKNGKVVRSRIGIAMVEMIPSRRAELGVPPEIQGVIIEEVAADGPNAKAGIAAKDIIVGFDGVAVTDGFRLRMAIALTPAGSTVVMRVWRKGQKMDFNVKCVPMP